MSVGRFYAMVGALLRSPDGRYLLLQRSADKDVAAGAWDCVTGRVDQGESFTQALHREVGEELGVQVQVDFIIGTVHFYRGETRPENELLGVQYCCTLENPEAIQTSWEHSRHRWVTPQEAEELFPASHWLYKSIHWAEIIRALSPLELLDHYRANGFEV